MAPYVQRNMIWSVKIKYVGKASLIHSAIQLSTTVVKICGDEISTHGHRIVLSIERVLHLTTDYSCFTLRNHSFIFFDMIQQDQFVKLKNIQNKIHVYKIFTNFLIKHYTLENVVI